MEHLTQILVRVTLVASIALLLMAFIYTIVIGTMAAIYVAAWMFGLLVELPFFR